MRFESDEDVNDNDDDDDDDDVDGVVVDEEGDFFFKISAYDICLLFIF